MGKTKQQRFIKSLSLKRFMTFAVMLCMLFSAVLMPAAYASEYDVSVQSEEQVLANGVYYLKKNGSYLASSLTLQSEKQTSVPDSLTQMWKIYHVGDGSYTIRPMNDLGECLNGAGMLLQLYDESVDDIDELMAHSRWVITETTSGYQIKIYTYQWTLAELVGTTSGSWELEQVTAPPSGVLLKSTQSWIAPKSTATFKASVYSGSTINQSVTWSSSNTNVAKVDSTGVVTGVSQGTATITAKSTYNTSWQKSFTVNVSLVPNGTYYIQSVASKSKVVDIKDSNTSEGESIHQFDYEGTTDQRWIFELQQDGYYTIKSVYSNLYLSVKNNSTSNGSEVVQNSGGTADGQRWSVSTTSSGAYKLKAKCAGTQDICLMKGTYIFYPNKLVHMAYTDNTTYDDEWLLHRILPMSGAEADYDPDAWENFGSFTNDFGFEPNCYSYAFNAQVYPGTNIPWSMAAGMTAGSPIQDMESTSTTALLEAIRADMAALNLTFEQIDKDDICESGTYRVAFVRSSIDYHWYRQDSNGLWSHKRGVLTPTNVDASENLISDPELADRNYIGETNYSEFIGYFKVNPINNVYVSASANSLNEVQTASNEIDEQGLTALVISENIENGMDWNEVVEILGEPDRVLSMELYIAQYDMLDGRHFNIQISEPEDGIAYVIDYQIVEG